VNYEIKKKGFISSWNTVYRWQLPDDAVSAADVDRFIS